MSKILALDQATRITGWSIFEDGKLLSYGKIVQESDSLAERLVGLRAQVLKLIQDNGIELVVMEDIQE
jgi:Holliday junction resolvasome RuvABC endonuclease subunit